ncbi:hypothetical protein X743_28600 [Mesorhizobium sp. LNHC252B00]|nr:hypothetical protein X743_28600 [Mesorhizobium sp. LNHC252B00]
MVGDAGIEPATHPCEGCVLSLSHNRACPRNFDVVSNVIAEQQENLPTSAKPILPLHLRPALLAGVAIVERVGPEMLQMLRGHMMGDNRVRLTDATENMIARARRSRGSSQMQLI